ncbi:hypothetical protein KM043_013151 [Ampulex compressa]|nr:hypothetical protein KM043_013151 [Ampulex compressa]
MENREGRFREKRKEMDEDSGKVSNASTAMHESTLIRRFGRSVQVSFFTGQKAEQHDARLSISIWKGWILRRKMVKIIVHASKGSCNIILRLFATARPQFAGQEKDLNNDSGVSEWTGLGMARIVSPANSANREQVDATPQVH